MTATPSTVPALIGRNIVLERFGIKQITERYLAWLADPEVNRFSQRLGQPKPTATEARRWLAGRAPDEIVYAIFVEGLGHVGNVKYGPIDHANRRSDIAILIGERAAWNRGVGTEAVYLVARHLFRDRGLNRVDAGSANPAFIRLVETLGWRKEGVLRQRVKIGDRFFDWILVAQLAEEFHVRPQFERGLAAAG